jgi:SAM-dependent methyltransferase
VGPSTVGGVIDKETQRYWEGRYTERGQMWSGKVNPWLAEIAGALEPGRALDLGCGEGADAVWLAQAGWDVVATDVSPTAVERTAARAAAEGVGERVRAEVHDLEHTQPDGAFDLVSAQFLMSPLAFARDRVLQALASRIVPGGRLLIVDHGAPPPWSSHRHDEFGTPEDLWAATGLADAEWALEELGTRARVATHRGQTGELIDNVALARRLG